MLNLEKVLDDWNNMTEDEKFTYVQFTYILCDYFGGDVNWCDKDGGLSDNEKKAVMDRLPEHLNKKIIAEDKRRREETSKCAFPGFCSDILQMAFKKVMDEFCGYYLNDDVKHQIMARLSEAIKTILNNSWVKDILELRLGRVDQLDGKPCCGLIVTFIQKEFKWAKVFKCWFKNDNISVKEIYVDKD